MRIAYVAVGLFSIGLAVGLPSGPWTISEIATEARAPDRVVFYGDNTGWICDFFPGVVRTKDGGKTWARIDSNLATERISTVSFVTENRGWAIGTSYSRRNPRPVILLTENGGDVWRVQKLFNGGRMVLSDIWFLDSQYGWVVGSFDGDAVILTTNDGGIQWNQRRVANLDVTELRRVRFANRTTGWAVGPKAIVFSNDGGTTWSGQYWRVDSVWLNSVDVVSDTEAWAAGGWGFLLHTTDGGRQWARVPVPHGDELFLWSVKFAGARFGWVCGSKGTMLSTDTAGQNWREENVSVEAMLSDLAVTRSHVFVTAGPREIAVSPR